MWIGQEEIAAAVAVAIIVYLIYMAIIYSDPLREPGDKFAWKMHSYAAANTSLVAVFGFLVGTKILRG